MNVYCSKCGKENPPDTEKCVFCDHPLNLVVYTNGNSKKKRIYIIIAVAVLVIFGTFYFLNLSNSNSEVESINADASNVVIHWNHTLGSDSDDYNVYNPYIIDNYLYIDIQMKINSPYTVQLRGFGYASINDTFSKTVPFDFEYEKSTVEKNEFQNVRLRISVSDLDVQKPTTLYCNLATYVGGKDDVIKLEFDISW